MESNGITIYKSFTKQKHTIFFLISAPEANIQPQKGVEAQKGTPEEKDSLSFLSTSRHIRGRRQPSFYPPFKRVIKPRKRKISQSNIHEKVKFVCILIVVVSGWRYGRKLEVKTNGTDFGLSKKQRNIKNKKLHLGR